MSITDEGEYGKKQIDTLEMIWGGSARGHASTALPCPGHFAKPPMAKMRSLSAAAASAKRPAGRHWLEMFADVIEIENSKEVQQR